MQPSKAEHTKGCTHAEQRHLHAVARGGEGRRERTSTRITVLEPARGVARERGKAAHHPVYCA
eukprot:3831079-Pleurochrysis_carterae.AAC.1